MVAVPYRLVRNLLVAAAALYCSLLLEAAAGFPLDVRTSFLSELGARDQSTSLYARAMDLSSSALTLLAVLLARHAREFSGLLVSAAVFAFGTMFDSFSPMDVVPVLHEATSTVAGVGSIGMAVCTLIVLRRCGWTSKFLAALAGGVLITQVWLGCVVAYETLSGAEVAAPGILQRASTLLFCLLLGTLLPGLRQALSR
ncbi:DUF998 domain-containing protein [Kribbella sp. NPDC051586]|uniref:DUF998 domain-containing protein n=1 Tax=Kribbella sp. NPDC051586 TaxID=3364118 RepID=UPI0037ACA69E